MIHTFPEVLELLDRLEAAGIAYALTRSRDEALMIQVDVPGERWEIEIMEDGHFEIEVFRSSGEIRDESALNELFERFSG